MTEAKSQTGGGAIIVRPEVTAGTVTPPGQPVVPAITPPPGMSPNMIVRTYRVHDGRSTHNKLS